MGNFILQNTEPKTTVSQFLTSNIKYDGGNLTNIPATTNSDLNTVLTDLNTTLASVSSNITGTANRNARWDATSLTDGCLYDDGTTMSFGSTPSAAMAFKIIHEVLYGVYVANSHATGGVAVTAISEGTSSAVNQGIYATASNSTNRNVGISSTAGTGAAESIGIDVLSGAGSAQSIGILCAHNVSSGSPTLTSGIFTKNMGTKFGSTAGFGVVSGIKEGAQYAYADATTNLANVYSAVAGNWSGTGSGAITRYSGYFLTNITNGAGTNVGGYFSATGGSNNYAAIFNAGNVGIGITAPTQKLHVVGTSLFTDHLSIANQKELKLFEASGSGTNYTSFKAAATMAGNVTYTYPAAAPLLNGQVLSSTTAGVMTWVDNSTIHVKTEQELLDAFTHFNAVGVSGTVKIGADITLSAHRTLDFNNGIELKGGGHAISSTASKYTLTFDGVTATVKDVMFTGDNNLHSTPTTQNMIKINSTTMKQLSLDCCWFNNLSGHRSATDGVNDYHIIIENCRSAGLYLYMRGIKITVASTPTTTKPVGPFKIKLDDADLDSMHFFARDWHLAYGEANEEPNRFNESRMSCLIKFDNYNTTDHPVRTQKRKFSFDDSVGWHPDSFTNQGGAGSVVAPWLDLYPTFYRNSSPITIAGAGAYLIGGALSGSASSYQDTRNVFLIFTSGSATSPTIQPDTAINYPIGSEMTIANNGAGTMTLTRGAGVALYNPGGTDANYAINGGSNKYGVVTIKKIAANIWQIINKT